MKKILFCLVVVTLAQCSADHPDVNRCTTAAIVRDLSTLDGCGFVFELADGTKLEPLRIFYCGTPPLPQDLPEDPLMDFQFADGKKVFINYEKAEGASVCMAGTLVRITCITEADAIEKD